MIFTFETLKLRFFLHASCHPIALSKKVCTVMICCISYLGQKGLDLEMAMAYWNIVLKGRFRFLDVWNRFLKVQPFLLDNFKTLVSLGSNRYLMLNHYSLSPVGRGSMSTSILKAPKYVNLSHPGAWFRQQNVSLSNYTFK